MNRRFFLKSSGIAVAGIGLVPSFLARAAAQNQARKNKILIAIFQRGAADGLSMVAPFGEKTYYEVRPSLAVPLPKGAASEQVKAGKVIDLDGFFGLHPALAPFKPIYDAGHLGILHAAGSPDNTRSHFDAQDFMESGTPGVKSTTDGWLNRHLVSQPDPRATPFRAVALGQALPRVLRGQAKAVALTSIREYRLSAAQQPFQELYGSGGSDIIYGTGQDMLAALRFLEKVNPEQYQPAAGVEYPDSEFARSLRQIAQLIKADAGVEVAFADHTGAWDTHATQGTMDGTLASLLTDFSRSIAALYADLGDRMEDVVIITFSEFGRAVVENGNRGTDHGHANAMFVLGGGVRGGKVYGDWPGLAKEQLYEGRDLAVTTDFRNVFGELLMNHLGNRDLGRVFPEFPVDPKNFRKLLRT